MGRDQDWRSTEGRAQRPFPESLCWRCAHHRAVQAARSVFVICSALPAKYPRQPVPACPGFQPAAPPPSP